MTVKTPCSVCSGQGEYAVTNPETGKMSIKNCGHCKGRGYLIIEVTIIK